MKTPGLLARFKRPKRFEPNLSVYELERFDHCHVASTGGDSGRSN